jgi:hypothetical protein
MVLDAIDGGGRYEERSLAIAYGKALQVTRWTRNGFEHGSGHPTTERMQLCE